MNPVHPERVTPSALIKRAAALARHDRLRALVAACETQSTISTRKVLRLLNPIANSETDDARVLFTIAQEKRAAANESPRTEDQTADRC